MAFQVDLSSAAGRREVAKLNASIDMTLAKLGSATGAAARLSAQMKKTGANPLREVVASMNSLNITMGRVIGTWGKVNAASTYTSDAMATKLKLLQREVKKLTRESKRANVAQRGLTGALGSSTQGAAAFRAAMYASHTHMGMFTANTLVAATTVYGLVAAIRGVIVVGGQFTQAFAATASVLNMSKESLGGLENQMLRLAEGTKFTATEVAQASTVLARTGMDANEVMQSLGPTLNLAAIGTMDMAQAADIASNVMHGFQLETKDLTKVVDVLAYTAIKSNTTVRQLGQAMSYAAPVAAATGADLNEVASMMGVMADSGIKASRAGTAMRRAYVNLLDPTKQAKSVLKDLNIATKDENGQMRSMVDIMRDFTKAQGNIQDLEALFGVRALAGMSAIWQDLAKEVQGGTSKIQEFAAAKEKMDGQAERTREMMENNLIDIWAKFKSAISTKAVAGYKELEGALTSTIKRMTDYVINSDELLASVKSLGASIGSFIVFVRDNSDALLALIKSMGIYLGLSKVILPLLISGAAGFTKIATATSMADLGFRGAAKGAGKFKIAMAFLGPIALGVTALTLALEHLIETRKKYSPEQLDANRKAESERNAKILETETRMALANQAYAIGEFTKRREHWVKILSSGEVTDETALANFRKELDTTNVGLYSAVAKYIELTDAVKKYDAAKKPLEKPVAAPAAPDKAPWTGRRPTEDISKDELKAAKKTNDAKESLYKDHWTRMIENHSSGIEQQSALMDMEHELAITKLQEQMDAAGLIGVERQAERNNIELELIRSQNEEKLMLEETYWSSKLGMQEQHSLKALAFSEAIRQQDVKGVVTTGLAMLKATGKAGKELFEMQKAYEVIKIAMKTPAAMADAFAWGTSIGGPVAGAAAAAAAGIAMAGYAASIAKQSYGGGGGSAGGAGGGGATTTAPAEALPATTGVTAQPKEITIVGLDPDSPFVLSGQQIMDLMQQAINDGVPVPTL